ncbi:MCE family protein [Desulfohalobiaceae bacterium Ax17]|uniref:MlaD family protein n=1 Tax=Desulfovulcanus ferrireducens TaxID=2831190 RepID=UPI00207B9D85|nr:MlaD family protein [Desulfovulcanus ferrireducens]MBT8762418.1 MCE family protein [Desulfovulcanus ferrireducens]
MSDTFKSIEVKVGIFLSLILCLSVFILIYIGYKKEIFSSKVSYYVISKTGENIERGIPVRLSGFKIGQVENVFLDNIDYVKVEIKILEKYQKWFRQDSRIILDQEGIIGNSYLKLIPGSEKSEPLVPGSEIILDKVAGLNEILIQAQPVIEDLKAIVSNVRVITDQFLDKNGTMQKILFNLEQVTEKLQKNRGLIYYLTEAQRPVRKVDRILSYTDKLMASMDQLLQNATLRVKDLGPIEDEFLGITKDARSFVQELQGVSEDISPILDDVKEITGELKKASDNLYRLREETEYTLRLGSELLQKLKQKWPFLEKEIDKQKIEQPIP